MFPLKTSMFYECVLRKFSNAEVCRKLTSIKQKMGDDVGEATQKFSHFISIDSLTFIFFLNSIMKLSTNNFLVTIMSEFKVENKRVDMQTYVHSRRQQRYENVVTYSAECKQIRHDIASQCGHHLTCKNVDIVTKCSKQKKKATLDCVKGVNLSKPTE